MSKPIAKIRNSGAERCALSSALDNPDAIIVRTKIRRALDRSSLRHVANALGLSCEAVLRLAADRPVHRGTLLLASTNLHNLIALVAV